MNCTFLEVSAKTEENIKKLLYTSIIELPLFDKFRSIRIEDLIEELENNNESKINLSSFTESNRNNNDLSITLERDLKKDNRKKEKCKC